MFAVFTVVAILGKPYIPLKTLQLHPTDKVGAFIYGAIDAKGDPDYSWIDMKQYEWRCDNKLGATPCGIILSWDIALSHGCGQAEAMPDCVSPDSDEDGDGWGWENEQSCLVKLKSRSNRVNPSTDKPEASHPECSSAAIDPDGDGWGWENERSCIFPTPASLSQAESSIAVATAASPPCINAETTSGTELDFSATQGIDFSEYDGMNVKIHYEGRARFVRLYLHNYNSAYADPNKISTTAESFATRKFMSSYLRTEDLKAGKAYISLSEFSVEEWWVVESDAPREQALPEFKQIVAVGIDHVEYGIHKMRVDSVELVGERVSTETFLMAILFFWSGLLLLEGGVRYHQLRAASRAREMQIRELNHYANQLEEEKRLLKTRAITDALTGSYNRAGVEQQLLAWCGSKTLPPDAGILMFDIDHFKHINDTHGHDVGDRMLKSLAQVIEANIRDDDVFARWGGEEFILICRQASRENLLMLAEKLRIILAEQGFEPPLQLSITVSIGAALARNDETFDTTLGRADSALYRAKITRNRVSFEGDDSEL